MNIQLNIEIVESEVFTDRASNKPEKRLFARANVKDPRIEDETFHVYSKPVDITEIGVENAKIAFQRNWEKMLLSKL